MTNILELPFTMLCRIVRPCVWAVVFAGAAGGFGALKAEVPTSIKQPSTVRVAGVVLKWLRTDKEANFQRIEPMIRKAACGGAQIVCTTESFLDGYAIDDKSIPLETFRALGERIPGGEYFEQLRQLADELNIHLVAGLLERDGRQLFNTAVILSPNGSLIGKYHKQCLEHEAVRLTAGTDSPVFDTSVGQIGVMICADRRDKDVVSRFCSAGADVLICPSGGMYGPEKNDWILQQRSRENGTYIVFVHPAEFLVTRPDGTVATRTVVGDRLVVEESDAGTSRDGGGVFYFDLPLSDQYPPAAAIAEQLGQSLLEPGQSWSELRTFVEAGIPKFEPPRSVAEWEEQAAQLRQDMLEKVVFRGEAIRWRDAPGRVEWFETLEGDSDYRIRKLAYEALPGLWIPALLYEPAQLTGEVPVVLNVNGHEPLGKHIPYKQRRCINLAKRGMLALSLEFLDMGQLRGQSNRGNQHNRLVQIDLCGTSGLAPFYLTLERGLDVALAHPHADPHRVGVAGLSGGGWQSILLAALDTRITLANPVAGYCSLFARTARKNNVGDAEQIAVDLCTVGDYTHLTALVAPRPLLLTYNAEDNCCFLPPDVLPQLEATAQPIYRLYGNERHFRTHVNYHPGTHNFDRDNREALYRLIGDYFFAGNRQFATADIEVPDAQIKTADELAVPLPTGNATLHSLAVKLSHGLPEHQDMPTELDTARNWQKNRLERLTRIIGKVRYRVTASDVASTAIGDVEVAQWRLRLADARTIPAVEFRPPEFHSTVMLFGDRGRGSLAGVVQHHLSLGQRVVALDPLGRGENVPHLRDDKNDDIALMLLDTIGHRPLGIVAAQLVAVAGWLQDGAADPSVTMIAVGPRSSVAALAAAASENNATSGVELHHCWASLHELIRRNMSAEEAPELFCFGLLKDFDIAQLIALTAPRPVKLHDPQPDHQWRLHRLASWYVTLGAPFDPLQ